LSLTRTAQALADELTKKLDDTLNVEIGTTDTPHSTAAATWCGPRNRRWAT
jgi:hypothetical protein